MAEEAAQEAFAIAAERWPREGTPANPRAWLLTTARDRAIDRIRRDHTLAVKARLLDLPETTEDDVDEATIPDERLELDRYHYLHATRAELLRRLDRLEEARAAYHRALELVHSEAERRFLEQRLAELQRRPDAEQ